MPVQGISYADLTEEDEDDEERPSLSLSRSREKSTTLGARVQQGLMPIKSSSSTCSGREAPKVHWK